MAHLLARVSTYLFVPTFLAGLASDPRRLEAWLLLSMALSAQTLKTLRSPAESRDAEARTLLAKLRQTIDFLATDYHQALEEQRRPRLQVSSNSNSRRLRLFAAALLVGCVAYFMEPRRLAALAVSCLLVFLLSKAATSSGAQANVPCHDQCQVPRQEPLDQVNGSRV
jgi:hypothetical protein